MANWEALFTDMLIDVTKLLISGDDFTSLIAFGGVCSSWRSVYMKVKKEIMKPTPLGLSYKSALLYNKLQGRDKKDVWLMLPENKAYDSENSHFVSLSSMNGDDDDDTDIQTGTFSIEKPVTHYMKLPAATGKRFFSFSNGWLLAFGGDYSTSLLHILSGKEIQLPGWDTAFEGPPLDLLFPTVFVRAALTADPSSCTDFQVIALYIMGLLVYASPQDDAWKSIPGHADVPLVSEIFVYKEQVHVMDCLGGLWLCDTNPGHEPALSLLFNIDPVIGELSLRHYEYKESYLVESLGDLLVIYRTPDLDDDGVVSRTRHFYIYKLDLCSKTWTKMESLGNRSIFVGKNVTFSVDASDVPGCRPDCVYFTQSLPSNFRMESDDEVEWESEGNSDIGIYDLEDCHIEPCLSSQSSVFIQPSIWVLLG